MNSWFGRMVILSTIVPIAFNSADCLAQCSPSLPPGVRCVDQSLPPSGTANGLSWNCAFRSLDAALAAASTWNSGVSELWVAQGTYSPTTVYNANNTPHPLDVPERTVTFPVRSYLHVFGGFLGNAHPSGGETSRSQANPIVNVTTLSGAVNISGKHDNAYHVVLLREPDGPLFQNRTIIDGFTITGGNANGALKNAVGGGVIAFPHSHTPQRPLFTRCTFLENRSTAAGGAASISSRSAEFRDCLFKNNESRGNGLSVDVGGGAIHSALFEGGNSLTIVKCRFEGNRCDENFGGAIKSEAVDIDVINSEFFANEALRGGAVYAQGDYVSCLYAGNIATASGNAGGAHGLDSATLRNCTLVHNTALNGVGGGRSIQVLSPTVCFGAITTLEVLATSPSSQVTHVLPSARLRVSCHSLVAQVLPY